MYLSQKNETKKIKKQKMAEKGKVGREELIPASTDESTLLKSLTELSKEIKDLKQDIKKDLSEFKNEVKTTMKADFSEFKADVLREIQNQNATIAEAQTRIVDLESACSELKETLITTVKLNREMRDKIDDLESRSRRNNLRIYGIPEDTEGKSVMDFVKDLLKSQLDLPAELDLQIQRAHRALRPKPTTNATARSIIVNFLQFQIKELVLKKAWQKKVEIDGRRVYFDIDYTADVVEQRKAYGPIKTALKEKGIRFQTPYTKMRIHWDTGLQTYGSAEEAAQDLQSRGFQVSVNRGDRNNTRDVVERLNERLPCKTVTSDKTAQRARERLTEFRRDS